MSMVTPAERRPLFVTDCEGPLTRNDNAAELAATYVPNGAAFFARLSKYDDVLVDVVRKSGYNAGTTLALIAPFFRAFGLDDATVETFSRDTLMVVPGADALVTKVEKIMPVHVISTSYTPYVRAVADVLGVPAGHCSSTELSLDAWDLPPDEAVWLRDWAVRIGQQDLIELPDGARGLADLSSQDQQTVRELNTLFWHELADQAPTAAAMAASVTPVGGHAKLEVLQQIVADCPAGADVMYVGDSITDAPPLAAVRDWAGLAVSFNGNGYSLEAAEIAVASLDTAPTLELARAFVAGGASAARELARAWPAPVPAADGSPGLPVVGVIADDPEALVAASRAARASVRGRHIARLG
jgi:energy-converting hydrogenase A subunit R